MEYIVLKSFGNDRMKYKSKVDKLNLSLKVSEHNDYSNCVVAIEKANTDLDENSKEYEDIITKFPKVIFKYTSKENIIKLQKNFLGMIFLIVKCGTKDLKFLLDTGAQVSCISSKIVSKFDSVIISKEKINVGGGGGYYSEMNVCYVKHLETCGLKINNLPMLILNENQLSLSLFGKSIINIQGILGWDVLSKINFSIDLKNMELEVIKNNVYSKENNFLKSSFPVIVCQVGENLRIFGLDLGARKSWISEKLVNKEKLKVLGRKSKKIYTINGIVRESILIIEECVVGILDYKVRINNINTGFTRLLNDYELDGVLGIDILKNKKLIIINSEDTMLLEQI